MMSTTKRHLLLHAGTPKTGTKSLQSALHASRARLLTQQVLYPTVDLSPELKHQWIVNSLVVDDLDGFRRNLAEVVREAAEVQAKTVVLSTEGIFLHWNDFSPAAKTAISDLALYFDVTVWTVFREPVSFAMSLYSQVVKNPPSYLTTCYATTLTPEEIADHLWFRKRLDYAGFVRDMEQLFGAGCMVVTQYESARTIEHARTVLAVDETILPNVPSRNQGLGALGLDLMLRLNQLKLDVSERQRLVSAIVEIDRLLCRENESLTASKQMVEKIRALSLESTQYLTSRFGIDWPEGGWRGGTS